jgi:uracil-DNA glycosylase family protein
MTGTHGDGAAPWVPLGAGVAELREASQSCRGCDLWRAATQTVFGEGPSRALMMIVGEQPGDREDRAGEPFVGPAGGVLERALEAADVSREEVYLTNAVKHFRFEERGKRRIHKSPAVGHVVACAPWLDAEVDAVDPVVIVCLGATAARAVLGRPAAVGQERGRLQQTRGRLALITAHPSSLLRIRATRDREDAFDMLVRELRVAAGAARKGD